MVCTPRDFRAEMFARAGTEEGFMEWFFPCRAMKAIFCPEGREAIVIGELGLPHGYKESEFRWDRGWLERSIPSLPLLPSYREGLGMRME
jgi:hypothetical protein